MTEDDADSLLESEQPTPIGLAYRMLGNVADAEQAGQEASVRCLVKDGAVCAEVHRARFGSDQ